jgi:sensor histidine kinase regulating citrate/malate metabolism
MNLLTDVNDLFKDGFTTKENGHLGNGLFSVKRLAEKYKGHVYPEFSENEVTFNIIFPKGMAV